MPRLINCLLLNIEPLPAIAKLSAINGMVTGDFDTDGHPIFVSIQTIFTPLSIMQSGFYIPGNGKALVKLKSADGKYLLAASRSRGSLKLFELKLP